MAGTKMKKAISFAKLDWDLHTPQMWEAINNGRGPGEVVQVGNITDKKDAPHRFFDGNPKSWAADIHPNGAEPSSLVSTIDYDGESKTLTVTYRDGFTAHYENIDPKMVEEFSKADSKGRWALKNLWDREYS